MLFHRINKSFLFFSARLRLQQTENNLHSRSRSSIWNTGKDVDRTSVTFEKGKQIVFKYENILLLSVYNTMCFKRYLVEWIY